MSLANTFSTVCLFQFIGFYRCFVHTESRFFSGVSLPPNFPGNPNLKIPAKLRETFRGAQSYFEQRLRSEQDIVSNYCIFATFLLSSYDPF